MPRIYEVTFENVAVSAAQDLVGLTIAAGVRTCKIKRMRVGSTDTSIPTAQMLQIRARLASATYSVGSAGSAQTPRPVDIGDAAATFTARSNDTTKGTTSGAFTIVEETGCHIYAGYDFSYPQGREPVFGGAEGFVFELLSTVSGTVHLSGGVTVEETGG
jgi:hypothetical protein